MKRAPMSYGDFTEQITQRGAKDIKRDRTTKTTTFVYKEQTWVCADSQRSPMAAGLSDGYEMEHCLSEHCKLKDGS